MKKHKTLILTVLATILLIGLFQIVFKIGKDFGKNLAEKDKIEQNK